MTLTIDQLPDHRAQYEANLERLAALDRLLAALRAHQAHPCSICWRQVLVAMREVPNPPLEIANVDRAGR